MTTHKLDKAPWEEEAAPTPAATLDEGVTQALSPQKQLTPEEITTQKERAQKSLIQPDAGAEFAAGLSSTPNYLLGLLFPEVAKEAFPTENIDKQSWNYILGTLADPVSALAGIKGAQVGGAVVKAGEGIVRSTAHNVAAGTASGAAVGTITEDQSTLGGSLLGMLVGLLPAPLQASIKKVGETVGAQAAYKTAISHILEVFPNPAERAEIVKRLLSTKPTYQGERVTAGMASVGKEGEKVYPQLQAMEEAAKRGQYATDLANIQAKNDAAMMQVFNWIAKPGSAPPAAFKGKAPLSTIQKVRETVTTPIYKAAREGSAKVDVPLFNILDNNLLKGLEQTPAVTSLRRLMEGSKEAVYFYEGKTKKALEAGSMPYSVPTGRDVPPPTISMGLLQDVYLDIGKRLGTLAKSTASADVHEYRALSRAKAELDKWMRGNSREWGDAQDMYAFMSEPQSQADVARVLGETLKVKEGPARVSAFLSAIRNEEATLAKALPGTTKTQISQVMTPTQMRSIEEVAAGAERRSKVASLFTPMAPTTKSTLSKAEEAMPPLLRAEVTAFRHEMAKLGGRLSKKGQAFIDNLVVNDPKGLAQLMKEATAAEKAVIMERVRLGPRTGVAAGLLTAGSSEKRQRK